MITNHRVIEASDHFVEESGHKEALGYLCRNAAGAQIEEFLGLDLPACCSVCAADVVGFRIPRPGAELASASSERRRLRTF